MPPTMLVPGKMIYPEAEEISKFMGMLADKVTPIQIILTWIKRKMSEYGGRDPKFMTDRILILVSLTGSGKSTSMPTMILRVLSSLVRTGKNIICTEPRIANALSISKEQKEASFNKDIKDMIGFATGPLKEKPRRGLIYATIGVLLSAVKNLTDDEIIQKYKVIIIDEAHILNLENEGLLARLKQFYLRNIPKGNKELPFLIITSATMNPIKYANYFGVNKDLLSGEELERVNDFGIRNVMEVTGLTFPVEIVWPPSGTNDYLKTSADLAIKIHKEGLSDIPHRSDIFIFVPGAGESRTIMTHLDKVNTQFRSKTSKIPPFIAIFIDSKAISNFNRDYQIFLMSYDNLTITAVEDEKTVLKPFRRIIICTTSLETGITHDGLKYVIDCGWNRSSISLFPWGFKGLLTLPATQSMITQRKGRVGRLFDGIFYPTYIENSFKSLQNIQLPEVYTEGVGRVFLDMVIDSPTVDKIDLLDSPAAHALHYSVDKAIKFGLINGCGSNPEWHLTEIGKIAAKFSRIDMFEARLLFMSFVHGVNLFDMINIVCVIGKTKRDFMITKKGFTNAGYEELLELSLTRDVLDYMRLEVKNNDVLKILISCEMIEYSLVVGGFMKKIIEFAKNPSGIFDWCEKNSIKYDGMMEILMRREDIINDLMAAGIDPWKSDLKRFSTLKIGDLFSLICRMKQCIYAGLNDNVLVHSSSLFSVASRHSDGRVEKDTYWNKGKKIEIEYKGLDSGNFILVGAIRITQIRSKSPKEPNPLSYKLVGIGVCVLDGYIDYDETLEMPRSLD